MEKIFKINKKSFVNANHLVKTEKGFVAAKDLKKGDVILAMTGNVKIIKIIECKKRPNAPIVGEKQ